MKLLTEHGHSDPVFWEEYVFELKTLLSAHYDIDMSESLYLNVKEMCPQIMYKFGINPNIPVFLEQIDERISADPWIALYVKTARTYLRSQVSKNFFDQIILNETKLYLDVVWYFQEKLDTKTRQEKGMTPIPENELNDIVQKYTQLTCYIGLKNKMTAEEKIELILRKAMDNKNWRPLGDSSLKRIFVVDPIEIKFYNEDHMRPLKPDKQHPLEDFLLRWSSLRTDEEGNPKTGYSWERMIDLNLYYYEKQIRPFVRLESLQSPLKKFKVLQDLELECDGRFSLTEDNEIWETIIEKL